VEVVEDEVPGDGIGARPGGGEDVLPGQARRSPGQLDTQSFGQVDFAAACLDLGPVAQFDPSDLPPERFAGSVRKQRRAVVSALAAAYHDLAAIEVDVFDPQGEALQKAEAGAVQQFGDEAERGLEMLEEGEDVAHSEDRGEMVGAPGALEPDEIGDGAVEDAAVQEDDGAERLVVGGGGDVALDGKIIEESGDLGGAQIPRVAAPMEGDVGADPVGVRFFGAGREVEAAERGVDGFEEGHDLFIDARRGKFVEEGRKRAYDLESRKGQEDRGIGRVWRVAQGLPFEERAALTRNKGARPQKVGTEVAVGMRRR
jgi:hypothetical protein